MSVQYSDLFDEYTLNETSPRRSKFRLPNLRLLFAATACLMATAAALGYVNLLNQRIAEHQRQGAVLNSEIEKLKHRHIQALTSKIDDFQFDPRKQTTARSEARQFLADQLPNEASDERLNKELDLPVANDWNASLILVKTTVGENYRHIDVRVEDPSTRQFVQNLSRKDFELSIGGQRISQAIVQKIETSLERRAIALVQDKSSSMRGLPDTHATQAMAWFASTYASSSTKLVVWKFANEAKAVTPCTSDKDLLLEACKPEEPSGATSLYFTFDRVVEDLARRPELRTMILLTDGADSNTATLPPHLEERCRSTNVTVHIIGLKSSALNETALKNLANATGGKYLAADDSSQIITHFKEIAQNVFVPAYRIIAFVPNNASGPMKLAVGNSSIDINP